MKSFILVLYFFSESIFFGTLALLSVVHDTNSKSYVIYNLFWVFIIFVIVLINFANKIFSRNKDLSNIKIIIMSIFLIIFMNILFCYIYYNQSPIVLKILNYFLAFIVPATLFALTVKDSHISKISKSLNWVNMYLTVCFIYAFVKTGTDFGFLGIGGATHLLIGYTMSALFPYNFIKMIHSNKIIIKGFYLCMVIINIFFILVSGSKGSLFSIIISFILLMYFYTVKKRRFFKYLLVTLILSLGGYYYVTHVQNNYFESALWRISLLFNSDFHVASSGRDVLYNNALAQIKEHPILGSGIGSYAEKAGEYIYPHNIILEILLDFGFIGLIFFVPIIIYLFLRTVKILNQNDISYNILGFFFLNSFIKLMFSGSYLADLQFCISIILITTTKILNERKQEIVTLNTEIKI